MNKKEIEKTEGRLNDKLNKIAINITENIKEKEKTDGNTYITNNINKR